MKPFNAGKIVIIWFDLLRIVILLLTVEAGRTTEIFDALLVVVTTLKSEVIAVAVA